MEFRMDSSKRLETSWPTIYWAFIGLNSVLYLLVAVHTPLSVLAWQGFDDMLFINNAQSLAEGRWLGRFSELTLVKGPGYPIFLAFNYWLGLPITFTHALFYCISLLALSLLALKISKSYLLASLLFAITLWDPRVFELNRIMRDAIYSGQAILIITCFSYSSLFVNQESNPVRCSVLTGVLLGWFWLTREEGIWLVPGLVYIAAFAILRSKAKQDKFNKIKQVLIVMALFIIIQSIFYFGNYVAYGKYSGVDIKEKNFQLAIMSMESVRSGNQIPYLSVPRDVRNQIYKISPAFSELEKYIDPDNSASAWKAGGCLFRPTTCGDIGNGFFFWAVRDAAGKAGYYTSPEKAAQFYASINSDIQKACEDNRLKCEVSHIPYLPPITPDQVKSIPSVLGSILHSVFSAGTLYTTTPWKILGPESTFNRALSILNRPSHYAMTGLSSDVKMAGWYHRKGKGNTWFSVTASDDYNQDLPVDLVRVASLDLVVTLNDEDATHQRFQINTRCSDGCKVTFSSSLGTEFIVPLKATKKYISKGDTTLAFDYINFQTDSDRAEDIRAKYSFMVRSFFHRLYSVLLPVLLVTGLLSFVLSSYLSIKKSEYSLLLGVASAFWISIIVRAVILVLVDISSFPAIINPYMLPIFSFSIIASVLSIGMLLKIWGIRRFTVMLPAKDELAQREKHLAPYGEDWKAP